MAGYEFQLERIGDAGPNYGDPRARARELIGAALESVQRGHGRLLFFEGSPGIGKTRLLDEILEQARAADMDVLCARGGELEREFPFGLVRQLFEPRLASASEEERSMLLAGAARLCAPLVSHELSGETLGLRASPGAGRIGGQAAGDVPYATLHALYWLSANLAGSGRLIWPQCGRLIWPHLRPIAVRPSALCRASKGSRGRDAIESGAVRADPQGP
jgi:hypothetical protein